MLLTDLAVQYVHSPQWSRLAPASRRIYMSGMEGLDTFGLLKMEVSEVTRPIVLEYRDYFYDKPSICRNGLTVLSNILGFGYDRGVVMVNHAKGVSGLPGKEPIQRWSPDEVAQFLETAPEYLSDAFITTLYTGQRRSDVTRMKWEAYDGRTIKVTQEKTGKKVRIPVHKHLRKVLNRLHEKQGRSPYILHNMWGMPWVDASLTHGIGRHARKIGLKGRSIHGLRKTAASTLAEVGCSSHEIAAITGQSLKEVENYTREADQLRMANSAMQKWNDDDRREMEDER